MKEIIVRPLVFLLVIFVRLLLRLRYRISLKEWNAVKKYPFDPKKGILFLPNHPAEIDPVLLEILLYPAFQVRPLVVEHFYYLKGFRWFMDFVGALVLPQMDAKANRFRVKRIQKQFEQVTTVLQAGGRLLVYPAGKLKESGEEKIGGASFVRSCLEACPDVQIVLIRTTGLWGSLFSKAITGKSPSFGDVLWQGVKILLKNGIFFAPKRDVEIEFEVAGAEFPRKASRLDLNNYLERWYNQRTETLKLVPYLFWSDQVPTVCAPEQKQGRVYGSVPQQTVDEVTSFLATLSRQSAQAVKREADLSQDLGLDSLDLVQVYLFLDEKYGISYLQPGTLLVVEDVMQAAAGHFPPPEDEEERELPPISWKQEERKALEVGPGATIQEAFLNKAHVMGDATACVDATTGFMTYRQLKVRALVLAEILKTYPEDKIGVLLPSSCAAYLVILAIMLSGKTPVMLNWTVGSKALDYAVDLLELKHVITSWRFLDRLQQEVLGKVEEHFCYLEEMREQIGIAKRLKGLWHAWQGTSYLKRFSIKPSDTAVYLFTSGTESLPKTVPLTHEQLLTNQRAALSAVPLSAQAILYGVLPPFHSFGFSVTGLFPLIAGLRVAYSPDPTDSHGMARDMERYRPTLLFAAPSFILALFKVAKPEQLSSLRLVVSGAERTPHELVDYVEKHLPQARLLEGYGVTECSPIVSIDRLEDQHTGVGKPLPGVTIAVIDPSTNTQLSTGKEGEICIAGPSVFNGYYALKKDPFVTLEGIRFYRSGDRGYLDADNHIILTGRLTRFVKMGGEMVSLGGIEEELTTLFKECAPGIEGPPLAVSAREFEVGKPELILFMTWEASKEEINARLKAAGQGRLVKISRVVRVESIPLTGTGKINYRLLEELVG